MFPSPIIFPLLDTSCSTQKAQCLLSAVGCNKLLRATMPSRKKSKGKKARKAKAQNEMSDGGGVSLSSILGHINDDGEYEYDEVGEVAESLRDLLNMQDMMDGMRDRVISSLGEGYDDESLKILDHKMCDYFLPEDSLYYDDDTHKKSSNPEKPTEKEIEHYKKSDVIRKRVLRNANGIMAISNIHVGQGHKNMEQYQEFYDDLITYHYAWFEIIFKEDDKRELLNACNTLVKFAKEKIALGGGFI